MQAALTYVVIYSAPATVRRLRLRAQGRIARQADGSHDEAASCLRSIKAVGKAHGAPAPHQVISVKGRRSAGQRPLPRGGSPWGKLHAE